MALPVFDTEEAVPEAMRPFYAKRDDGKWAVKPEEVPDVTKLERTIERERELKTEESKRATKAENDLAALRLKQTSKETGVDEATLNRLREEEKAGRKPIEDEVIALKGKVRKLTLTDRVQALGLAAGWMPDRVKQAMTLIKPHVDLAEGSDEAIVVLDDAGKVTTTTIEHFLANGFKTANLFLYKGSGAKGSGATGSTAGDDDVVTPPASEATQARKRDAVHSAL